MISLLPFKTVNLTCSLFLLASLFYSGESAYAAQGFTVSPILIERTTEARDMFSRTITLTNQEERPLRVYASVHEVKMGEDTEIVSFVPPSMSDRTTSVTSWIAISRARLEVPLAGTLDVPLSIKIHPQAPAGTYYAFIGFATGSNRDDIEATIISGAGKGVILKLTIAEKETQAAQLVTFQTDRFSMTEGEGGLSYTIENTGESTIIPKGEVIIYDQRGKELTYITLNTQSLEIPPGARVELSETLPFLNRIGRQKAYLALEYGDGTATVFDTTFYYSVPWYYLLALVSLMLVLFITIISILKRAFSRQDESNHGAVYEVPVFVKKNSAHNEYDHDLHLKHVKKDS